MRGGSANGPLLELTKVVELGQAKVPEDPPAQTVQKLAKATRYNTEMTVLALTPSPSP